MKRNDGRWLLRTYASLIVVLAVGSTVFARARPCGDGRFLVPQQSLVPGGPPSSYDVVVLNGREVGIVSGCSLSAASISAQKAVTKIRGHWPNCGPLQKVVLKGKLELDCSILDGHFKSRKRPAFSFRAYRSVCGDNVVDRGNGEACDPPNATSCDANCKLAVSPSLPATTSTTLTSISTHSTSTHTIVPTTSTSTTVTTTSTTTSTTSCLAENTPCTNSDQCCHHICRGDLTGVRGFCACIQQYGYCETPVVNDDLCCPGLYCEPTLIGAECVPP
jgi:hypothetical protein